MTTPQEVKTALDTLQGETKDVIQSYILKLESELRELKGEEPSPMDESEENDEPEFPPLYESGEDFDKAGDAKAAAADCKGSGDWEGALAKYTEAVMAAPPSALLYANRANALLQLGRPRAAVRDCDLALKENPDSAKALRMRGKAKKDLGIYEEALQDLSASQAIDFDEGTVEDLKFLTEKHLEMEKEDANKRNEEEARLRKIAEERKAAQEEAKREAEASANAMPGGMGGMPGMPGGMGGMPGMPGGMGGMPGMPGGMAGLAGLMNDPEIVASLQNPKVQSALQGLMMGGGMPDPAKLQELMSDPEVGPVMSKIMSKMGGGMPGGMGGEAGADDDEYAMPDLDDLPDLE